MDKRILVSAGVGEIRAAVLEDRELVELSIERSAQQRVAGSIVKGRVQNVLPGMQAAFVDIGLERNAFLYIDDALPLGDDAPAADRVPSSIKDVLRPGQELVVQVIKEPIGTKGARVTRHVTLPGRYVVLMPDVDYVGVSRRIRDEQERERLKAAAGQVRPVGAGLIIRTVAEGAPPAALAQDVAFLDRVWQGVRRRQQRLVAPALLHQDLGLVDRVLRDWLDEDVAELLVDDPEVRDHIAELLEANPELQRRVKLFSDSRLALFDAFDVDRQLEKAMKRKIWLKSGGYLVLDETEALTAIDVNTGKFVGSKDLADTVFRTNMEAVREIARQLRLRDIGGIIIIDFIDMTVPEHRQQVLDTLADALRADRTRTQVLGLTQLGLVEVTRKKQRESLRDALTRPCPNCEGRGRVRSEDEVARRARAEIRRIFAESDGPALLMELHPAVAAQVIGPGGSNLRELETRLGRTMFIRGNGTLHVEDMHLVAVGDEAEIERQALPVRAGQVLTLEVQEPHVAHPSDGIARLNGYVIDIEAGGGLVGQMVQVEILRTYRTYARARLVAGPAGARVDSTGPS